MKKKVVITGIGVVSGYGLTTKEFWDGIIEGKSAITPLELEKDLKMKKGATLPNYNENDHFPLSDLPLLDRFSQLAILASKQAFEDSGLIDRQLDNTATIIGSGNGGKHTDEEGYKRLYKEGNLRVHPLLIPKGMHSAVASNVSKYLNTKGPTFSVSSACSSGAHAIIQGVLMIQAGLVDSAVVGGSDAPFSYGILKAWDSLRVVTNDKCRPFSKNRSGMILGEGAGIFVIESEEHAKQRGAEIYAEIGGFGMSSDAGHYTKSDINGVKIAMQRALENSGISPDQIDYINAHGTGTPANDGLETQAIRDVFGKKADSLRISSTKPLHGHALGASSAIELAVTALAIKHEMIPPTINLVEKDEECDLDYVLDTPLKKKINAAMSNSFAFGGLNAVMILKRWNDI